MTTGMTTATANDTVRQFLRNSNIEQLRAFHTVVRALREGDDAVGRTFFLHATAGTGKTYVAKALIAAERCCGRASDVVASSGFAADLLPPGTTAHAKFGIPVPTTATSASLIRLESDRAQRFKVRRLVIWDEVIMASSAWINCVDRLLRDVMDVDLPFGGKVVLLMGDTRQILPVVPGGSPADILRVSVPHSDAWQHIRILELTKTLSLSLSLSRVASSGFNICMCICM